jgi:hypothetical protein
MTGHTPGPWAWSPHYKTGDGRATWSLIGSQDGYGILSCDGDENSPQGLNDEANARLIAAAPELLEALIALLPHVEHHDICGDHDAYNHADVHTCGCGPEAAVEHARAAIAKARGEQP